MGSSGKIFFDAVFDAIQIQDAGKKCQITNSLFDQFKRGELNFSGYTGVQGIPSPGLPENLELVAPRHLKKRGIASQVGRTILMHAIAHIEFNAINLALDAAYRFRNLPADFYHDWMFVAADEARHFSLICDYLNHHKCEYGDFPAHSGLWDMAVQTQSDVVARMALVPRVLEARGLDVTPSMIERLANVGDNFAAGILQTIYEDEIQHVKIGSKWFKFLCDQRDVQPGPEFVRLVDRYLHGKLRGPFNTPARRQAGFDDFEMSYLDKLD